MSEALRLNRRTGGRGRGVWWWRVLPLLPWAGGLGLLTAVGVSALCGLACSRQELLGSGRQVRSVQAGASEESNGIVLSMYEFRGPGVSVIDGSIGLSDSVTPRGDPFSDSSVLGLAEVNRWVDDLAALRLQDRPRGSQFYLFAQGLPVRCFDGAEFPDAWPEPRNAGILAFGEWNDRVLCFRPRWGGLATDAAAWGLLWLCGIAVPLRARGRRRRARGLCPECGYDLRGDLGAGCPECGWDREDTRPPVLTGPPALP